jgi:parallel beta-helix repeat protein
MKTKDIILTIISTLALHPATVRAQGALTPPGAPAPTMKSLDQVEARTIVNGTNTPGDATDLFVISQPGSYYLTTNIVGVSGKNGIEITANNVTLDLNGFALQGVSGAENAIYIPNASVNVTVRNGAISGWEGVNLSLPGLPAMYQGGGVVSASSSSLNLVFERLNVAGNSTGFSIFSGGVVRDCNVANNSQDGMDVSSGTVSGCAVQDNGGIGIYLFPGTVTRCLVQNNAASGIYVESAGSEVIGNNCLGNNSGNIELEAGILINASNNRVEDNHVTASGYAGIALFYGGYANNIIIKNSVAGNGANDYYFASAQIAGPLISVSGTITSSNPFANFAY